MKKIFILCAALIVFTADAAISTPLPGLSAQTGYTVALNNPQNLKFARNWKTPSIPQGINFKRAGNGNGVPKMKQIAFIAPWRPSWLPNSSGRYWSKRFRGKLRSHKFFRKSKNNNSPSPVPEPATMLLFGTGLIGLTIISRKKNKK